MAPATTDGNDSRYVIDPEVDCLVVPSAPPTLFSSKVGTRMPIKQQSQQQLPDQSKRRMMRHHKKKSSRKNIKDSRKAQRDEYKHQGDAAFQSKRYAEAIEQYTHALAVDPKSHVILSNRSAAYYKQGDKSKALYDAHASVEVNPHFYMGYARLAAVLQSLKQWEHAVEAYKKMIELDENSDVAKRGIEGCSKRMQQEKEEQERRRQLQQQQQERDSSEDEEQRDSATRLHHDDTPEISSSSCPRQMSTTPTTGLSELSKQLRTLQATNATKDKEIERLERQLRIMSELKGISLPDLRCELQTACQDEAHDELRNQVDSLRSQLDASRDDAKHKDVFSFEQETSSRAIATLELRVGELEEIEAALREENCDLYKSLREETSKVALLTATCEQQQQKQPFSFEDAAKSKSSDDSLHGEIEHLSNLLRDAELQLRQVTDRANLLEEEAEARKSMAILRSQQYNCRLGIQDERIQDLEQQLSSLYAAFEMLRGEGPQNQQQQRQISNNSNNSSINIVNNNTSSHSSSDDSDSVVARRLQEEMNEQHHRNLSAASMSSVPQVSLETTTAYSNSTSTSSFALANARDAYIPENAVSGYLWKNDAYLGGWNKRYFCLQGSFGDYQLSYSEGPRQQVRCELGDLVTGVSTVARCHDFDDQPHALVLHINPHDSHAPVLYAAASNEKNLKKWLKALTIATRGPQHAIDSTTSTTSSSTARHGGVAHEGESDDLEAALRCQRMELNNAMRRRHSCH